MADLINCDTCKGKRAMEKTLCFSQYPEILIVQLKRFVGVSKKIHTKVGFTTQLHMDSIHWYTLVAVINHIGSSPTSGPYCKSRLSDDWYDCNDSSGVKMGPHEYNKRPQHAYILFYEREAYENENEY